MLVRDVKAKYPFLFEAVQIHKEFQRIKGVSCLSTLLTSFTMYRDKILNFPFKDKRSLELVEKVTTRCRSQPSQEKVAELQDWAMALVPSLFKMDSSLVMGFAEEHSDENSSPYLTLVENPSKDLIETKQFYVTVEAEKFGVAKTLPEGLALLVCSYWIFDMQYPKESKDFFNFLETALLKLENIKATRSVATVIAKLNANH